MGIIRWPYQIGHIVPRRIQESRKIFIFHIGFSNGAIIDRTVFTILQIDGFAITNVVFCNKFIVQFIIYSRFIEISDIAIFTIIGKITNGTSIIVTIMEIRSNLGGGSQAITGKKTKEIADPSCTFILIKFIFNRANKIIILYNHRTCSNNRRTDQASDMESLFRRRFISRRAFEISLNRTLAYFFRR